MIDASTEFSGEDKELLKILDKEKTVVLLNKCDKEKKVKKSELSTFSDKTVELSALKGNGVEKLKEIIENIVMVEICLVVAI